MANEKRLMRDVGLKPRTTGDLPPEKLERILGQIYPEEVAKELMDKLCDGNRRAEDGNRKAADCCW